MLPTYTNRNERSDLLVFRMKDMHIQTGNVIRSLRIIVGSRVVENAAQKIFKENTSSLLLIICLYFGSLRFSSFGGGGLLSGDRHVVQTRERVVFVHDWQ